MAYQILSPSKLSAYKPTDYRKDGNAIVLNDGVKPIAGTFKVTANKSSQSLDQTLPSEKSLPVNTAFGQVDQLTALKLAMGDMSRLALKQGLGGGTKAILGDLDKQGLGPEHIPGGTVGNIINFVENQVGNPIQNELSQMNSIIDAVGQQRNAAQDQVDKLISNGLWSQIDPTQRQKIWNAAGYTGAPTVTGKTSFEHFTDADGHVWNVQYDAATGDLISKTDFGPIGKGFKPTGPGPDKLTDKEKLSEAISKVAKQLQGRSGADGYVSPDSYKRARTVWVTAGLTAKDYDDSFAQFANPSHLDDYDLLDRRPSNNY